MKTIYTDLITRLQAQCPFLRTIDLDMGQLEIPYGESKRPPLAYPCALITIDVERATDLTPYTQDCEATITIRYATDRTTDTAAHINDRKRTAGLNPYEEVAEIYTALQGWSTEYFSPLSRTRQGKDRTPAGIFGYTQRYTTSFIDETITN